MNLHNEFNAILGTMNIAYPYTSSVKSSIEHYTEIIEKYISYTNNPILDTAYYYGNTKTEQLLGKILPNLSKMPKIVTKANPWFENDFSNGKFGQLGRHSLDAQLYISLQNMGLDQAEAFYLHCPDYETPLEETLEICDELWRKEKFNHLGISNFSHSKLLEVLTICDIRGYNAPKYYQGMYNLICRKVEVLFPLLDDNNIDFWAYNPLAGGLLTGKYKSENIECCNDLSKKSRFHNNQIYQDIFWKKPIISHLSNNFFSNGDDVCIDYAFQWLKNYSKLRPNDRIILGVSTIDQLEMNKKALTGKKCYSTEEIQYLDDLYKPICKDSPNYYY